MEKEQKEISIAIEQKCREFECPGKIVSVQSGPIVTTYEFVPNRFIRIKRLKGLHEDLALALAAENVSVMRVPGKSAVAITVPNKDREVVTFQQTLKNVIARRNDMELPINFGVTAVGEPYVEDLARMPHLLVAGSTGSGKSVFLNNVLTSLMYIRSPKEVELILIDPKSVELRPYETLPHVKRNTVECDIYRALAVLSEAVQEMRKRMAHLHYNKCKNLKELNDMMKQAGKPDLMLPYQVIVIDEMSDIVIQEKKAFTKVMAEISSMARAAGIHVIAATQRPSVDVLSGKIKVNFPARVTFRMPSSADSRTILSRKGAEQLLARGDMLYISPDKAGIMRLHAPLTTAEDVSKMMELSIALGHFNRVPADGPPESFKAPEAAEPEEVGDKPEPVTN